MYFHNELCALEKISNMSYLTLTDKKLILHKNLYSLEIINKQCLLRFDDKYNNYYTSEVNAKIHRICQISKR